MAILYNLGSNFMLGEISYITKALAAVLSGDHGLFYFPVAQLLGRRKNQLQRGQKEAMAHAIANTITSVVGSSITTIAGFIALCFIGFTLGWDLGIVMAKGRFAGGHLLRYHSPSLILILDRPLEKTMHRALLPNMSGLAKFITKHAWVFLAVFLVLVGPALYGYNNTKMYYDLLESLPRTWTMSSPTPS